MLLGLSAFVAQEASGNGVAGCGEAARVFSVRSSDKFAASGKGEVLPAASSFLSRNTETDSLAPLRSDSLVSRTLSEAAVIARPRAAGVRRTDDGAYRWDLRMLGTLPQILGNADPLHYTQLLPGVQTASEYDAGIHVQGCDNGHNAVSIEGVPVYNPAHAIGLFSTFNGTHFPALTFALSPRRGAAPSRLGGTLAMHLPQAVPDSVGGDFALGPLSAQGTLRFPLGRNTALFVSGRGSFLNLFYGNLLKVDGSEVHYALGDANVTLVHDNGADRFRANLYLGLDRLSVTESDYQVRSSLGWGNGLASLEWTHRAAVCEVRQTVYATAYANRFGLREASMDFRLRSGIADVGYAADLRLRSGLSLGVEAALHDARPQSPRLQGGYAENYEMRFRQRSGEYAVWADYAWLLSPRLTAHTGMRAALYDAPGKQFYAAPMPSAELVWKSGVLSLRLGYAYREQYLFQTGFSGLGLPTEFWFSADANYRPQSSHGLTVAAEGTFGNGAYAFSVEAYYKFLRHQVEYDGTLFDFLNTRYSLADALRVGSGRNYGVSVMLRKERGRLTGWVAYSFGRARRTYADEDTPCTSRTFSANHERPHELNVVASWRVTRRLTAGGTFVFASGTPFTAPEHFYLLGGKLLSNFAARNAARLPAYCRLDLSADIRLGRLYGAAHGLNFSLYNALARRNAVTYRLKVYKGRFSYAPLCFLVRVLPSVSYYVRF